MLTHIHFPALDGELDRFVRGLTRPVVGAAARGFRPAVDVVEDADRFVLTADLPGVRPEDVNLTFEKGVLTLSGTRPERQSDKALTFHRTERGWGTFERRFALPDSADGDRIEATYDAGVLTITIGKRQAAKPRTIEIKR